MNEHAPDDESEANGANPELDDDDSEEVSLTYDNSEGFTETVRAQRVGAGRYRLLETPVFSEDFTRDDIVALAPGSEETLTISHILEHSGLRKESWFTSTNVIQSDRVPAFLEAVMKEGGFYQIDSFFPRIDVSLPAESTFDVRAAFLKAFEE
jgi:hypothetical protein